MNTFLEQFLSSEHINRVFTYLFGFLFASPFGHYSVNAYSLFLLVLYIEGVLLMNFDSLFQDFADVSIFVIARLRTIFMSFYNTSRFGFLFNMAILPVILFLAFDIVFSFVLSVKFKRLVIFNVISPRSGVF